MRSARNPVRHLNITLNWYCGDSGMAQNTHRLTITTDIHQSIQPHPMAVGRTGESVAYDMGVFWSPSSGWVRPFPFLNSPRKLSWSRALWKPAPGLLSWPVVLQVAPCCSQSTGNSVSKAVPGRLPTWVSFRSCRETQLSQLRLVGISPTISQLSDSSQYLSIVSWYLRGKSVRSEMLNRQLISLAGLRMRFHNAEYVDGITESSDKKKKMEFAEKRCFFFFFLIVCVLSA